MYLGHYTAVPSLPAGALPFLSAVYSTDPRILPIVYDFPACESVTNSSSLLECPRVFDSFREDSRAVGQLGLLLDHSIGSLALTYAVGVSCEGTYVCESLIMYIEQNTLLKDESDNLHSWVFAIVLVSGPIYVNPKCPLGNESCILMHFPLAY